MELEASVVYLQLEEENPQQRYLIADTGTAVVRLSLEEAEGMAIQILRLLSHGRQPDPNVVNIAQFRDELQVRRQRQDRERGTNGQS
jgi:hypothetical protein